jgi:hypothetical protein
MGVRAANQGMVDEGAAFESHSQAAATLFALIREVLLQHSAFETGAVDEDAYHAGVRDLQDKTAQFERKMEVLEAHQLDALTQPAAISVRIYHSWLKFIFLTLSFDSRLHFDGCTGYFQRIIALAYAFVRRDGPTSSLRLSLEPAVIVPLFDSVKRCRHPVLRRHGLDLMKMMNRHEGMWRSDGAAIVLETLVATEEADQATAYAETTAQWDNYCADPDVQDAALAVPWGLWASGYEPPTCYPWDGITPIPEEKRVLELLVLARFDLREIDLRLLLSPPDPLDPEQPYGAYKDIAVKF